MVIVKPRLEQEQIAMDVVRHILVNIVVLSAEQVSQREKASVRDVVRDNFPCKEKMTEKSTGLTFVIGNVQIWIHFEPRDMWFGVYWNREDGFNEVYVCLLPMIPIRFMWMYEYTEEPSVSND